MKTLAPRDKNANKGDFGTVLIIGGAPGMSGAPLMAAQAALRAGAGKAIIATHPSHATGLIVNCPQVMCYGVEDVRELQALLTLATHVVVGPGLGQTAWSHELFTAVLSRSLPMVVDADALNLLAKQPITREHWILTPHVAEAARLLNCSLEEIINDRHNASIALQKKYGGVIVLKGAGTLIIDKNHKPSQCAAGNPGMASAGMGDILSGLIAALVAQGLSLFDAAELGVNIHANAGDLAAKQGMRGMMATDLLPFIRQLVNG
ncbi:MAG: NAD(P)H-hydrate dehydratase [Gammaproteobacteria bacterium]|jgi:NAD(P)H-hydrate epimerase